jgi:hypothetical protein
VVRYQVTDQYSDTEGQELPGTGGEHVDDRGMGRILCTCRRCHAQPSYAPRQPY